MPEMTASTTEPTPEQTLEATHSRRDFLRTGALVALAAGAASAVACADDAPAPAAGSNAAQTPPDPRAAADTMDAMHEAGVKSFPAVTAGKGNQLMAQGQRAA